MLGALFVTVQVYSHEEIDLALCLLLRQASIPTKRCLALCLLLSKSISSRRDAWTANKQSAKHLFPRIDAWRFVCYCPSLSPRRDDLALCNKQSSKSISHEEMLGALFVTVQVYLFTKRCLALCLLL